MERTEIVESSDIEYPKAKLYKRWFSGLIDIILTLFIGFLLYGITALVTNYVPSYKENSQTRLKLEIESGLYDSTGNLILNTLEDNKDSYDSKKTNLSKAIDDFYSNSTFFDDDTAMNQYKGRKENAIDKDGNKLFVLDSNSNLTEGNLKAETYYDFYVYEISNYSIALLSSSDLFQTTSRVIVLTSVIEMFICFGIGYFISFNLIPMFLKRGRKTFGMYLFNLSVLTDEGLVVSGKKFVARQLLPAGVNPSFRAESRSSDFSFCDAFPIGISGLNVSRSTSVARDGCRNLQQRELFGSYTRFPFHPGAAKLRRAVGTLGEAKIRRIFQKAAFYGKKAATSRKDRRRRVADRAVGTGFRHSARCQPVVPWCSGQPPS